MNVSRISREMKALQRSPESEREQYNEEMAAAVARIAESYMYIYIHIIGGARRIVAERTTEIKREGERNKLCDDTRPAHNISKYLVPARATLRRRTMRTRPSFVGEASESEGEYIGVCMCVYVYTYIYSRRGKTSRVAAPPLGRRGMYASSRVLLLLLLLSIIEIKIGRGI